MGTIFGNDVFFPDEKELRERDTIVQSRRNEELNFEMLQTCEGIHIITDKFEYRWTNTHFEKITWSDE